MPGVTAFSLRPASFDASRILLSFAPYSSGVILVGSHPSASLPVMVSMRGPCEASHTGGALPSVRLETKDSALELPVLTIEVHCLAA